MSTFYRVAYRLGFHPWEDAVEHPPFVGTIRELFDHEENGREPPYGRALDIGTGSGIWAVELAERGWQVTGIDVVDRALQRAHDRVRAAEVDVRLVQGDVAALREAGVDGGFRLLLDTGTFHGLNRAQRQAMGREIDAVATDDATVLLLAWAPRRRGPLPRGVSVDEIQEAFPGWTLTEVGPTHFEAPGPVELLMKPDERWYRLRRETANGRAP
jgi:SAM-dependent methyltransferase